MTRRTFLAFLEAATLGSLGLGCGDVTPDDPSASQAAATSAASGSGGGWGGSGSGGSDLGGSGGQGGGGPVPRGCNRLVVDGPARDVVVTGPDAWRPKLLAVGDDVVLVLASGAKADSAPSPSAAIEHVAFPAWADWPDTPVGPAARLSDVGGDAFLASPASDGAFALLFPLDYEDAQPLRSASYRLAPAIVPGPNADATPLHDVSALASIARAAFLRRADAGLAIGMFDTETGALVVGRASDQSGVAPIASLSCVEESSGPEWTPWVADALETASAELLVAHACEPSGSPIGLARLSAEGGVVDLGAVEGSFLTNEVRLVARPDGGAWLLGQMAVAFQTSIHQTPLAITGEPEAAASVLVGGVPTFAANAAPAAAALGGGLVLAWIGHGEQATTPIELLLSGEGSEPIEATLVASAPGAASHGIGSFDILASPDRSRLVIAWAESTSDELGPPFSHHVRVARLACAP